MSEPRRTTRHDKLAAALKRNVARRKEAERHAPQKIPVTENARRRHSPDTNDPAESPGSGTMRRV